MTTPFVVPLPPPLVSGWSVVSADRICANPPVTPPELIHGLLYHGGTFMMSGPSKAHKTYTMLAAGHAVASGGEWMGFETTKSPVIYLNLELQDFAIAQRLHQITAALGEKPSPDLHFLNLRGKLVTIADFAANLKAVVKETGAKLVIVDPYYKISSASGIEENSNNAQAEFLYRLENECTSNGAALMNAHHFAKGDSSAKSSIDRAAGGGAIARWGDVIMTLTPHKADDCMTAEFSLRNFAPVDPFVVRWTHPIWTKDETLDPKELKRAAGRDDEHPASELLEKLNNGMSNVEWRKASGWTDSTFRRKRDQLVDEKKVRLVSGCYYRNPPQSPESPKLNVAA